MTNTSPPKWHIAGWHPLAWLETGIKLVALGIGFVALVQALSRGGFGLPTGSMAVQWAILIVLSLGLLAAILDRLAGREIVAMVFVLANNLGHWGMVVALASPPGPGSLLTAFGAGMLAGDLVKLVFLRVTDFSVREYSRSLLYGLTGFYALGYLVVLILQQIQ